MVTLPSEDSPELLSDQNVDSLSDDMVTLPSEDSPELLSDQNVDSLSDDMVTLPSETISDSEKADE
jgi:3-hydroxy-3-methylglutaryl CoA synthase